MTAVKMRKQVRETKSAGVNVIQKEVSEFKSKIYLGAEMRKLVFSLLWIASQAFAISEKNYSEVYSQQVEPFYETAGTPGYFSGKDGIQIAYRSFVSPNE